MVLETALHEELTEHLGHTKHHAPVGREDTKVRNGTRAKTVSTEGDRQAAIEVPGDRDGSFEPVIVPKPQRWLNGVDEIVFPRYAKAQGQAMDITDEQQSDADEPGSNASSNYVKDTVHNTKAQF